MRKLTIFIMNAIVWFRLCAADQASAPYPGHRPPSGNNPAKAEKEFPVNAGADVLTSMDSLDAHHTLIAGDWISIRVLEDRRPASACRISASGDVIAPYIGAIKAAGLTPKALAFQVKARLEEKKIFPAAHVVTALDRLSPTMTYGERFPVQKTETVVVRGAVAQPGVYEITGQDVSVSTLLRWAGGHTSGKKTPKILIYRKTPRGNKRILVNTKAALNKHRDDYDVFLRDDDVLLIE